MPADDKPAPPVSGTDPPPPAEPSDESPPREPTTAPGERAAQLARLGDRIAELSARIQAATHELLVLIREFDEREGWDGCVSCAQWLSGRTGLSPGAAREHVRVARALGKLPKLSDATRRGRVSYSKVRAVTRVATAENEEDLLYVCLAGTAAHVERIARAWRRIDRNVEQAEAAAAGEPRAADVGGRGRDGGRPGAVDAGGRFGTPSCAGGGVRPGAAGAGVGRRGRGSGRRAGRRGK